MATQAQTWVQQNTSYPAVSNMPRDIQAVNTSVAWTYTADGAGGGANLQQSSRTSNGGTTWTSGAINVGNEASQISDLTAADGQKTATKLIKKECLNY
jgi:hypothetical protein